MFIYLLETNINFSFCFKYSTTSQTLSAKHYLQWAYQEYGEIGVQKLLNILNKESGVNQKMSLKACIKWMRRPLFMKKVIVCLFAAFALGGCNKKSESPTTKMTPKVERTDGWERLCDIPNPGNPYDYTGSEHNRLMALVEGAGSSDMSLDDVYALSDEILHTEYEGRISPDFRSKEAATPVLEAFESEESLSAYIHSLPISELHKEKFNEMSAIIFEYDGTNLCEIISRIQSFENSLVEAYSSSDMEPVLIASSIARYSLAYWHDRVSSDMRAFAKLGPGFWKKFVVGLADVLGGVAGGFAGGPVGGITGALGASAGAAKLWDIFAAP